MGGLRPIVEMMTFNFAILALDLGQMQGFDPRWTSPEHYIIGITKVALIGRKHAGMAKHTPARFGRGNAVTVQGIP